MNLWRRSGLPGSPRAYDLEECVAWVRARESGRPRELTDANAEFRKWRAELTRLRFEIESGKHIPAEAHDRFLISLLTTFRERLLHDLPASLPGRLAGVAQEAQSIAIEDAGRELLEQLADDFEPSDPSPKRPSLTAAVKRPDSPRASAQVDEQHAAPARHAKRKPAAATNAT